MYAFLCHFAAVRPPFQPPMPGQDGQYIVNNSGNPSAYAPQSNNPAPLAQFERLSPLKREIVNAMQMHAGNSDGVSTGTILKALSVVPGVDSSKISYVIMRCCLIPVLTCAIQIREAMDELLDEGLIFTTINDSHYGLSI